MLIESDKDGSSLGVRYGPQPLASSPQTTSPSSTSITSSCEEPRQEPIPSDSEVSVYLFSSWNVRLSYEVDTIDLSGKHRLPANKQPDHDGRDVHRPEAPRRRPEPVLYVASASITPSIPVLLTPSNSTFTLTASLSWVESQSGAKAAHAASSLSLQPEMARLFPRLALVSLVLVILLLSLVLVLVVLPIRHDLSDHSVNLRAVLAHGVSRVVDDELAEGPGGWLSLAADIAVPPRHPRCLVRVVAVGLQVAASVVGALLLACSGSFEWRRGWALLGAVALMHAAAHLPVAYVAARLSTALVPSRDGRPGGLLVSALAQGTPLLVALLTHAALVVYASSSSSSSSSSPSLSSSNTRMLWGLSRPVWLYLWAHPVALTLAGVLAYRLGAATAIKPLFAPPVIPAHDPPAARRPWFLTPAGKSLVFACCGGVALLLVLGPAVAVLRSLFGGVPSLELWSPLASALLLVIGVAAGSVTFTFARLRCEDPRWAWDALLLPASSGLWFAFLAAAYIAHQPCAVVRNKPNNMALWVYTGWLAAALSAATAAISLLASFVFLRVLYRRASPAIEASTPADDVNQFDDGIELQDLDF